MSLQRNQKLTNHQIQTIKELKDRGVSVYFIAQLLEAEGLAKSTAYYHLSNNRQAYDNNAKKNRARQREYIQKKIAELIEDGKNTLAISKEWNIPLATLNKIYIT